MLKKSIIITLLFIISACTREVYLQPVPCVEGSCQKCPCEKGALECCEELKQQTEIQHYQVYDVPTPPTTYTTEKSNCRKVCRKIKITPSTEPSVTVSTPTNTNIEAKEISADDLTNEIMSE